ncbi:TPA: hypothetical protein QB352_001689 [Pasteurella multocida]|nr:hypothetical protein [Pasteurella multocida]
MKKAIIKTSVLIGLSSLLVACGGGSDTNAESNKEAPQVTPKVNAQPQVEPKGNTETQPKKQLEKEQPQDREEKNKVQPELPKTPSEKDNTANTNSEQPVVVKVYSNNDINTEWDGMKTSKYDSPTSINGNRHKVEIYDLVLIETPDDDKPIYDQSKSKPNTIVLDRDGNTANKTLDYSFDLVNGNIYYGYYLKPEDDHKKPYITYSYAFEKSLENKNSLANYSAKYSKYRGFLYSVKIGNGYIPQAGNVDLVYTNGKISGEITNPNSVEVNNKVFDLEGQERALVIRPNKENEYGLSPTGGDNMSMNLRLINSNQKEYIVGAGKADKYYGVLFAEKTSNK